MDLSLPKIIFGSSALGNQYAAIPYQTKLAIVENWIRHQPSLALVDSAGKYGAGLSLECIGRCLGDLGVDPSRVLISNKLGWKRVPLSTPEPTFERGVWIGIEHDAVLDISYDGILECYEQGNEFLGDYQAKLLSVHDPDEYLAQAKSSECAGQRYRDILEGYRALDDLRAAGSAVGIGIGSKDWRCIKQVFDDGVPLDWVMFANSFTLYSHPPELFEFMDQLAKRDIKIINSAVFNAGFLLGGRFFDYEEVTPEGRPELFEWRDRFHRICGQFGISPALACCQFALSPPGVVSLALNSSKPERVADNVALVENSVPDGFWNALKKDGLLEPDSPCV
jgi:D-threo-aldose 1-dehydrogenase